MTAPLLDPNSPYAGLPFELINGYARVTVKGHPLADGRGRVRLHRAVLFDAIGPGPHRCHWCGWDGLSWSVSQSDLDYLVVDHVDGDSLNDVLVNLKAAHKGCNDNRAVIEGLGIDWAVFADVAPGDRPALRLRSGEPTAAALLLARPADAAVLVEDPPPPFKPGAPVEVRPVEKRRGISYVWSDVVDVAALEAGRVRLLPPPAHLLEKYPQLRAIDWEAFGR